MLSSATPHPANFRSAGNVGTATARAITTAGHEVIVADVSEAALTGVAEQVPEAATSTDAAAATTGADVVVLAVPFGIVEDLVSGLADTISDNVVIDATNPLADDLSGLVTDGGPAGAERVQQAAPNARVIKAFNTVFAGNQAVAEVDGTQLDGFVAGDDADAKHVVTGLLEAIGFRVIDVGALSAARYLEGMGYLNIALNARNDLPWRSAWKLVGPVT